jgi:hypothetical protein
MLPIRPKRNMLSDYSYFEKKYEDFRIRLRRYLNTKSDSDLNYVDDYRSTNINLRVIMLGVTYLPLEPIISISIFGILFGFGFWVLS